MQFELLMCLLLHMTNGNVTFVKEYTTAEIICPLKLTEKDNVSWYYEENKPLVLMNVINPEFKFKYSINNDLNKGELSINVYNFTENDEGKYGCQGIFGGEHKDEIVTVLLCRMSDLLSTFTQYLNVNVWSNAVQQRLALCLDGSNILSNGSGIYESFSELFKLKYSFQLTRMMETTKDKLRGQSETYICFTVNEDQCIITDSDSEFYIKVKLEKGSHQNRELYTYTCICNSSGVEENIDAYYLNRTLLFRNSIFANDGFYQCSLVQNKTDNKSTIIILPKWASEYLLIGASVVCGMVLVGVFICAIKRGLYHVYDHPNVINPPESSHSGVSVDQEHGFVDHDYEEIDSVSYHLGNLSNSDFGNNNRRNSERERVSDNRSSSSSSRSSLTSVHFYINTSNGSTLNISASYETDFSHASHLCDCDIWTNTSHSNNTSESGILQVNQYINIPNFPKQYEDLNHQNGDSHTYDNLPSDG